MKLRKFLDQSVGYLVLTGGDGDAKMHGSYSFMKEVKIYFNVFHESMKHRIFSQSGGPNTVTPVCWNRSGQLKLLHERLKSGEFSGGVRKGFDDGAGNYRLLFQTPGK